jgi:hypothetical protein
MRKALSVSLLIMLLACSALADPKPGVLVGDAQAPTTFGDIQPGDQHTSDASSPGDVHTGSDIQTGAAATFVQVVLNLLALS